MKARVILWLMLIISIQSLWLARPSCAELDEKEKQDSVFLAKYACTPQHFLIEKYFKEKNWGETLKTINHLEKRGYGDRFLTTVKSRVLARMGDYRKALGGFEKALQMAYRCKLSAPRYSFASVPALADQAIVWYNIYEVYTASGDPKHATDAYHKAKDLLRESLDIPVSNMDQFETVAGRVFYGHSIFRDELPSS